MPDTLKRMAVFALFVFGGTGAFALPLALDLDIGSIQHPSFSLSGLKLKVEGKGGFIKLAKLDLGGQSWQQLGIECGRLNLASGAFHCGEGRIILAGQPPLPLEIRQQQKQWRLRFIHAANEYTEVVYDTDSQNLRLEFVGTDLKSFSALLPQLATLSPAGKLQGRAAYDGKKLSADLAIQNGGYAVKEGNSAAEKMAVKITAMGEESRGRWKLKGRVDWQAGDWFHAPLFLSATGQSLEFNGEADASGWLLSDARLNFPKMGEVIASGRGSWGGVEAMNLKLSAKALALQTFGEAVVAPVLASHGTLRATLSGTIDLDAELKNGELSGFALALENAGFALEGNRFALEGMSGRLDWQEERQTDNTLTVKKMAIGRLESGAFKASFAVWPGKSFALTSPIAIPLLDGELILKHLAAGQTRDGSSEWEGALGLSLTPMALEDLTERLGLPIMAGAISADLPVIRYVHREAALDGALVIRVFDGYLHCSDLRLIDPFGARPRILADVEARNIDLEQLTRTFSFGRISGFVDAGLKGLEIAAWRPLAFNASIVSSPGKYPRRISQRAVDDITSLGGGGAMANLQASVLKMFSDFGYRRIGLSCRLENGICHMQGIPGADKGEQYVIVEGGGIPSLNIMGFNRRIDWDELISRVKSATKSGAPTFQ